MVTVNIIRMAAVQGQIMGAETGAEMGQIDQIMVVMVRQIIM
jgi:hypothetical protein